ncbi:MAG: hypothetical protein AB7I37_25335 [Pirellulales bacterium]
MSTAVADKEIAQDQSPDSAPAPKRHRTNVRLQAGCFVVMVGERWFKCTDVNEALDSNKSKIGLLLSDVGYDHKVGIPDRDCKTFTLRQYYQNGSPTLDYTDKELEDLIAGWMRHASTDGKAPLSFEKTLRVGVREFERLYKDFAAELEEKLAATRLPDVLYVPQAVF